MIESAFDGSLEFTASVSLRLCKKCGTLFEGDTLKCGPCRQKSHKPDADGDRRRYFANKAIILERAKERNRIVKETVFAHYGGVCCCPGCDETRLPFLCLDHVDGNGVEHRGLIGRRGSSFYRWLLMNNYPADVKLQILCHNCNVAKRKNSCCPVHGPIILLIN